LIKHTEELTDKAEQHLPICSHSIIMCDKKLADGRCVKIRISSVEIKVENPDVTGIILTALCWATLNASSEQLLWIYIFESWDLFQRENTNRLIKIISTIVGLLFFTVFVGLIHVMFWARFLKTVDAKGLIGTVFIILTSVSGYLHIVVWRKSSQMLYTFIPHFMLNVFPLIWTGYSMLPYLFSS